MQKIPLKSYQSGNQKFTPGSQRDSCCPNFICMSNDDLEELRKQVAVCLYTIQSFYSNTNWVEMKGSTPYLSFG
jgi:hypothetical protein